MVAAIKPRTPHRFDIDTTPHTRYGATAAARLAVISYRQIDHWERMGVLKPSIHEANGSGDRRQYSKEDVRVLAVLGELSRLGAPLQNLQHAESAVRRALGLGTRWLIVAPSDFVETCNDSTITMHLDIQGVRGAWIVDIESIVAEVEF